MPYHWLEFQPMRFKIVHFRNKTKEKETRNHQIKVGLFKNKKKKNELMAQSYSPVLLHHLLIKLPSPSSWGLCSLHDSEWS